MKTLETFNPNNQVVAFATRKKNKLTTDERLSKIEKALELIMERLNKYDELFKSHGWIKKSF